MAQLSSNQVIARAKVRKMPPVPAPRSRADAVLDGDPLYTVQEAAAILMINPTGLHGSIVDGSLPVVVIRPPGGIRATVRIYRSTLAAYMQRTNHVVTKKQRSRLRRIESIQHHGKDRVANTTRSS